MHMLTINAGGATQEFEVAGEADETLDLVRTLFESCQKGQVVEIPVRVPGADRAAHLIVNTPNVTSALIWHREDGGRP